MSEKVEKEFFPIPGHADPGPHSPAFEHAGSEHFVASDDLDIDLEPAETKPLVPINHLAVAQGAIHIPEVKADPASDILLRSPEGQSALAIVIALNAALPKVKNEDKKSQAQTKMRDAHPTLKPEVADSLIELAVEHQKGVKV